MDRNSERCNSEETPSISDEENTSGRNNNNGKLRLETQLETEITEKLNFQSNRFECGDQIGPDGDAEDDSLPSAETESFSEDKVDAWLKSSMDCPISNAKTPLPI